MFFDCFLEVNFTLATHVSLLRANSSQHCFRENISPSFHVCPRVPKLFSFFIVNESTFDKRREKCPCVHHVISDYLRILIDGISGSICRRFLDVYNMKLTKEVRYAIRNGHYVH